MTRPYPPPLLGTPDLKHFTSTQSTSGVSLGRLGSQIFSLISSTLLRTPSPAIWRPGTAAGTQPWGPPSLLWRSYLVLAVLTMPP